MSLRLSEVTWSLLRIGDLVREEPWGYLGSIVATDEDSNLIMIEIIVDWGVKPVVGRHVSLDNFTWLGLGLQFSEIDGKIKITRNDDDFYIGSNAAEEA